MANLTWPAWFDGPNGETEIFSTPEDVPAGWTSGAEKVTADGQATALIAADSRSVAPAPKPVAPVAPLANTLDAHGHPFDPAKHTGTLTKAGLWRMKVGVPRPAPVSLQHDL